MNLTVFLISLAIGGLLIGALFAVLLPRIASGGIVPAVILSVAFTVVGGYVITDLFELEYNVGLPLVLALSPLYLFVVSRSDGSGGFSTPWSGGDYSSGDCASDGGGDGGGGCD